MTDREPGTREDGEALPPAAIDPRPDGKDEPDYSEERRREEKGNRGPGEMPGFGQGA